MNDMTVLLPVLAVGVAIVLFWIYLRHAKTSPKKVMKSGVDLDKLFLYLGSKDNIISVEHNGSKITFQLKEPSKVNHEGLKEMGASGIVASKARLTVIFGKSSEALAKEIGKVL